MVNNNICSIFVSVTIPFFFFWATRFSNRYLIQSTLVQNGKSLKCTHFCYAIFGDSHLLSGLPLVKSNRPTVVFCLPIHEQPSAWDVNRKQHELSYTQYFSTNQIYEMKFFNERKKLTFCLIMASVIASMSPTSTW